VTETPHTGAPHTVAIVGGGFSGAVFGLKLHRARPEWRIIIAEPNKHLGRGIAYGACGPQHLLNVPVSRMEIGLHPSFGDWLQHRRGAIAEALVESGLDLPAAYVPRRLFGDYLEERIGEALNTRAVTGLTKIRGEVVRLLRPRAGLATTGVLMTDGREIRADTVVLAMGNLAPRPPGGPDRWLYDTGFFIPDPWARDAFSDVDPGEPLLLIGAGLTMVDIALRLAAEGHRGPILAVSRRGLMPRRHQGGGAWPEFLADRIPASPLALTRILRSEIARAADQGIPWQRVFDAARPAVPSIWASWNDASRRQFLRHLRVRWDIHRHRMAPRIDDGLKRLLATGALEIAAGRIGGYRAAGACVDVTVNLRGGTTRLFRAGHVVNCTGPGGDFDRIAIPLIADLRERRLAVPDTLGVGLQTQDCAVIDAEGRASSWLFALGPLTRPNWWEITAVPEINLQIDRLVAQLTQTQAAPRLTAADFLDIGGGI
jgi:uncharacterized NAD(P)/FAD-binding protein YdhS